MTDDDIGLASQFTHLKLLLLLNAHVPGVLGLQAAGLTDHAGVVGSLLLQGSVSAPR